MIIFYQTSLKQVFATDEVFTTVEHLFNISLQSGVFPDKPKNACVTPVIKNSDYLPLSSMPVCMVLSVK